MTHTYTPGSGYAVAFGELLLFLPDTTAPETLAELWDLRRRQVGGGFLGILSALTMSFDPTLENLPRFALLELGVSGPVSREARIAVCGDLAVSVGCAAPAAPLVLRGEGAAMWLEERVPDAISFSVSVPQRGAEEPLLLDDAAATSAAATVDAVASEPGSVVPNADESCAHLLPFSGVPTDGAPTRRVVPTHPDRRQELNLVIESGVVQASRVTWAFAAPQARELPTNVVPTRTELETEIINDDFGRTLAALPDSWDEDDIDSVADSVFVDSIAQAAFERVQQDFVQVAEATPEVGATEVLQLPAVDVIPTEVLPAESKNTAEQPVADAPARTSVFARATGFVRFSHGEVVELGAPVVVGRKPSHEGSGAEPQARMISVPSPSKDISRNHVMIRVEQESVAVIDLDSVNGTVLKRTGKPDRDLVPFQSTTVAKNDVLDLGDGVTMVFELTE